MDEQDFYVQAENELRDGNYDEALWEKFLIENEGDRAKAEKDYIETRASQMRDQKFTPGQTRETGTETYEFHPSRKPVKKRNIAIGITLLILLLVLVIFLGFLLHDYFN